MRKHLYTALIIALLASQAHAQFSEIWTNGDLFATEQMASQCYSASVERCVAVGITPDEPSWYDYILGKNHAKLVSVKNNIKECAAYPYIPVTNIVDRIGTNTLSSVYFSGSEEFLNYCGLPTNSLDETPYFKTQYSSTTGGWHSAMVMLKNLTKAADYSPDFSFNSTSVWYGSASYATNTSMQDAWDAASSKINLQLSPSSSAASYSQVQTHTNNSMYPVQYVVVIDIGHQLLSWKRSNSISWVAGTNSAFLGEVFLKSYVAQQHGGDGGYYDLFYDPQLDSVSTNWDRKVVWTNAVGQEDGPQFVVSYDTNSIPPNYEYPRGIKGWEWDDFGTEASIVLFDFSITNGFKYR